MAVAPVLVDGPVGQTQRDHAATLTALRDAVARSADLWRGITTPNGEVPGLSWTAAETAAHVIGDLRDYTQALTRYQRGYMTHANRPTESPSRLSAAVNARHLAAISERDMPRLAALLQEAADAYLVVAATSDVNAKIPTPNGLVIGPSTMTCLLLGEQLIHGLDAARSAGISWSITGSDALLVIPGVLTVAPQYLRPARAAGVRCSFELRMRGGAGYRLAVSDGTAVVTGCGERADCTITADPVAFLLLGYGRIRRWSPVLRGKLRPGGRKPWLAMKFGKLLSNP
jgi:hypothetical protein